MDAITYAMSKKYTDSKVTESGGLHREIVNSLPSTGDNNIIYMVLDPNASSPDVYDEWLWVNGAYEHIGSTRVDLSDYYNKTQIDAALSGKADIATTLSGYGITDAYTKTQVDASLNDVYEIMSKNGAKNLIKLPYTDSSGTVNNGITFTLINNVVIKAKGTATADAVFTINDWWNFDYADEYILNCENLKGSNDTYYVSLDFMDEENHSVGTFITTGSDVNVTIPQNAIYAVLTINIKSGTNVSNGKIFKPMIRPASDTDDVYQTPVKTNKELTDALNNMQNNRIIRSVNISSYNISRPYQCPEDGYIELNVPPGEHGFATIDGQVGVYATEFFDGTNHTESGTSLFVRKGMRVWMESATSNEVTLTYYRIGTT